MAKANGYYNFMENKLALGKNGTHLVHAGAAGGATWAVGHYGGVEIISENWYSPFIGALAGLGMSITVRYLLVGGNDEKTMDLVLEKLEQDSKGRKMTADQRKRLAKVVLELKQAKKDSDKAEVEEEEEELDELIGNFG